MKINNNNDDFEDYLSELYTPLSTIKLLSNLIFEKANNDWDFFEANREQCEEMLSLVFAIKTISKNLLDSRKTEIDSLL